MKKKFVVIAAVILAPVFLFAQGTLTLHAGDAYIYQFNNLPLQTITANPGPPGVPSANLGANFLLGSLTSDGALLAEMFEDRLL